MSIKIALAGNPNCGKTTLFNALTGSNQFVGNWPGVTVEKKEGKLKGNKDVTIMDLPGIYSLSPYTLEEVGAKGEVKTMCEVLDNAISKGRAEGIQAMVESCQELGVSAEAVKMQLVKKFSMTEQEAQQKLELYWK